MYDNYALHLNEEEVVGNKYLYCILIVIAGFFLFFVNNGTIPADYMESRNLASAQEMVRTGNYLIPAMNGEIRLEKPPLPTWIAAFIEKVSPDNIAAQRSAAGIAGCMMALFLYFLVSESCKNRRVGFYSALTALTCINILLAGRTASWDIYCHSFMMGAIFFLFRAMEKEGPEWDNFILSGIFMGLSFLSKGPVAFYALLLPFLIAYFPLYRHKMKGKLFPFLAMILIFVAIGFGWYVYILSSRKEAILYVVHKESSSWIDHNVRPVYYYWKFPGEFGIWASVILSAIAYYFCFRLDKFKKEYRFYVLWFLFSLILLSIIPEKKNRYLLPALLPGSAVVAFYFYETAKSRLRKANILFKVNFVLISLAILALPFAIYFLTMKGKRPDSQLVISALLSLLTSVCIMKCVLKRRINTELAIYASIFSMILASSLYMIPISKIFINPDRHSIKELRVDKKIYYMPFYYNKNEFMRMELVYALDKTIRPIDAGNDSVYRHLPFVYISTRPISKMFSHKKVKIERIGFFDDNWQEKKSKRYNPDLTKEVAVISRE